MAKSNQSEKKNGNVELRSISNISEYKSKKCSVDNESSAFQQVMSQMNIADKLAFGHEFSNLWDEGSKNGSCLTVFICEIDFFESYHENYGEQGTSFMLLVIGLALKNICEQYNCFLAHYKNDSFAILMLEQSDFKAADIAEQLCKAVEQTRTEHKYSKVSDIVTLSVGVSSNYPISMKMLLKKTNSVLEISKSTGRNTVTTDLSSPPVSNTSKQIQQTTFQQSEISPESQRLPLKSRMLAIEINGRRTFQNNFTTLWQRSLNEGELVSMLICKIDHFQAYVDYYGEPLSENLLLTVGHILKQVYTEIGGVVYHAGGQKFITLIKGGNATSALRAVNCVHKLIAEQEIEHLGGTDVSSVTLSSGLSSIFPDDANSMKMLMNQVDEALKKSIYNGRNQTSVI